jgi:hypothetical protein
MGWRNSHRHRGHEEQLAGTETCMTDGAPSASPRQSVAVVVRAAGFSASAGHGAPPAIPPVKHSARWRCEQQATLHLPATCRPSPCDGMTRWCCKRRDGWWRDTHGPASSEPTKTRRARPCQIEPLVLASPLVLALDYPDRAMAARR